MEKGVSQNKASNQVQTEPQKCDLDAETLKKILDNSYDEIFVLEDSLQEKLKIQLQALDLAS